MHKIFFYSSVLSELLKVSNIFTCQKFQINFKHQFMHIFYYKMWYLFVKQGIQWTSKGYLFNGSICFSYVWSLYSDCQCLEMIIHKSLQYLIAYLILKKQRTSLKCNKKIKEGIIRTSVRNAFIKSTKLMQKQQDLYKSVSIDCSKFSV